MKEEMKTLEEMKMEEEMSMQEKVIEMVDERIESLGSDLIEAKLDFANIILNDGDYQMREEKRTDCKVLEGKVSILKEMMNTVNSMTIDIKIPSLVKV